MLADLEPMYVARDELKEHIKAHGPLDGFSGSWAVVDVRDEDFDTYGGHVRGCVHVPSEEFDDDAMNRMIAQLQASGPTERVIFHCTQSQIRGPTCARAFQAKLSRLEEEGGDGASAGGVLQGLQVCVLQGGFRRWGAVAGDDPDLIAKA